MDAEYAVRPFIGCLAAVEDTKMIRPPGRILGSSRVTATAADRRFAEMTASKVWRLSFRTNVPSRMPAASTSASTPSTAATTPAKLSSSALSAATCSAPILASGLGESPLLSRSQHDPEARADELGATGVPDRAAAAGHDRGPAGVRCRDVVDDVLPLVRFQPTGSRSGVV